MNVELRMSRYLRIVGSEVPSERASSEPEKSQLGTWIIKSTARHYTLSRRSSSAGLMISMPKGFPISSRSLS